MLDLFKGFSPPVFSLDASSAMFEGLFAASGGLCPLGPACVSSLMPSLNLGF